MSKKYLIIRPKYGLCNQLLSISKGIIFSLITNRDLIFAGFQIDYRDENNICDFDSIIDINHLQNIINILNLDFKIYSNQNVNSEKIKIASNETISYIKNFLPYLFHQDNVNIEYLDVDNPISAEIPDEYQMIFKNININIKFTDKYIELANDIKKILKLNNYICIHLRLEDDAIRFMKENNTKIDESLINEIYKEKYLVELNYLEDKKISYNIYICTSLFISNNINNSFYQDIKKKYNLLDKNDFINNEDLGKYREIYGIIDYIIAKDSIYFIGADWSSFSIYINDHHIKNNIASKLINIYQTIKLL